MPVWYARGLLAASFTLTLRCAAHVCLLSSNPRCAVAYFPGSTCELVCIHFLPWRAIVHLWRLMSQGEGSVFIIAPLWSLLHYGLHHSMCAPVRRTHVEARLVIRKWFCSSRTCFPFSKIAMLWHSVPFETLPYRNLPLPVFSPGLRA